MNALSRNAYIAPWWWEFENNFQARFWNVQRKLHLHLRFRRIFTMFDCIQPYVWEVPHGKRMKISVCKLKASQKAVV